MSAAWRLLAEPPDVPGLVFRGFRGDADFGPMADVLNAACVADGVDRIETPQDIATNYAHLDNCDPATDMIFAEVDGEVVAYGRVLWWEEHDGPRRYMPFCFVHPAHRGRGIGAAMLTHNEARLVEIAAAHSPGGEQTFEVFHADTEKAAAGLFRAAGYEPALYSADMARPHLADIPDVPLPEGLIVRTPSDAELRAVWEAEQEAFRDHVGWSPPTENGYQLFLKFPWNDPTLWQVAWDGDVVAGQVRSFINATENEAFDRKRGYTEYISVRRPYRRRGLARALLVRSLHALAERGMEEASLGVLTDNIHGAFRLYESVGFEVVRTWTVLRKPIG